MKKKLEQILYSKTEYLFGMRKQTAIDDIVSKSDLVVQTQDRISQAYGLMKQHKLKHIAVVDQGTIVGIISSKDIKRLGFGYEYDGRDDVEVGLFDMLQVDQVMDKNPPSVFLQTTVLEAAELLIAKNLAALPVLHEGQVVGHIDVHDILLFLLTES